MSSVFRKGTNGWVMDENRKEYLAVIQKLRALRVPEGTRDSVQSAIATLEEVLTAYAKAMDHESRVHPEDLA